MNKSTLSNIAVALVLAVTAFLYGYLTGLKPYLSISHILGHTTKIVLLIKEPDLFPTDFIIYLKKRSLLDIEIITAQNNDDWNAKAWKADIIIDEATQLKKLQDQMGLSPLHRWFSKKNDTLISPDFLRNDLKDNASFPIFWRIENKPNFQNAELVVLNLWVPPHGNQHPNDAARLIEQLIDIDVQTFWLYKINWNTTQKALDIASIPTEKKSTALRKHNLIHLFNLTDKKH